MDNPRLDYLREKVRKLPLEPGVYLMRDQGGTIIYVGKAKALKNRVSSYFRSVEKHEPKVYKMVSHVYDFDYIVTESEFEALVLECSLIKEHSPKYNILLKDDKGYHYVRVSPGPWSKITAVKQRIEDGSTYLGPYTSSFVVSQTVDEVNKVFQLPTCSKKFPQDFRRGRPCLNYYIKQCMAPCQGKIRQEDYMEAVSNAMDFMRGSTQDTLGMLKGRMEQAAQAMEFEKAARYRDRIQAIEKISSHQKVIFSRVPEQDIIAFAQSGDTVCAVVIQYRSQRLVDKQDYLFGEIQDLEGFRSDFILRYYSQRTEIPKNIYLDSGFEDFELVERYLSERAGRRVVLHIPQKGEQLQLVQMAYHNAAQRLSHETARTGREVAALDELARLLGLGYTPSYIEAYDISNIGSATIVGGMVVFENGRPLKSAYKKFSIRSVSSPDDYACMQEVLERRLKRYYEEKDTGSSFGRLPDLILLDGGKGHVSTVEPLVRGMGFSIPVFGMVKDDRHRTRAITSDGAEISIQSTRSAFTLVSTIQDEVHRFTIGYSKNKHSKTSFESALVQVEGIGATRAKNLMKHFKTIKAIREADADTLRQAPGMNTASAENLYRYLHTQDAQEQNS